MNTTFSCVGCGKCCTDHHVPLTLAEARQWAADGGNVHGWLEDILGPERSWTVPYADDFSSRNYPTTDGMPNFAGASLSAFVKLGRRKGYRLVGVNRYGYNAFFVRSGLGADLLPEIEVKDCFGHPKAVWGMRERFPTAKDLPWVEV